MDDIRTALRNARAYSGEILNYKKSGEPFWNDLTILPIPNSNGDIVNFIGIVRDISAKKNFDADIIAKEDRHHFLLDRIQAGIVIHGANTEILYANAKALALLNADRNDIQGVVNSDPRWTFIREDGSQMPVSEFPVNQAIETLSTIRNFIIGKRHKDCQDITWLMCNAYPVLDIKGKVNEIVVSFTDITDLKQTERALQKSDERLRLIIQGSNDAPWDWDKANNKMYYSQKWWDMIGYEPDELPAGGELWVKLLHHQDRKRVSRQFTHFLNETATSYEIEFRLRHKKGHFVPVLSRGIILRDDSGVPVRVSGTNTDLTERKNAEERIKQLAFYDPLTSLPNRRLLMEKLHQALAVSLPNHVQGALLFIDLDNFKILNDAAGHDMGDQLLQQVALRLKSCIRAADTLARLGGDEFVVLLENLPGEGQDARSTAARIGQKILKKLELSYRLAGIEHASTASLGIALFKKGELNVECLLKQADLAMYQAKTSGGNTLRIFDIGMQTAVDERMTIEAELRKAVRRDEMELYFQPQVNSIGAATGAEVLIRWQHPRRGLLSPDLFIPIAEATGIILPIGRWVLHRACIQLVKWSTHPLYCKLHLSVNVSVRQFHETDFVADVLQILAETGADPAKLKFELTESLLAENIDQIVTKMNALRARGIRFSLDDFGTGYSSLSYLQRMPLDELKIDKTFVRDASNKSKDSAIARIIITLAENLGLSVIAEGVETEAQRQFLSDNGCHAYQGYLFGRPMSIDAFETLLLQHSQPASQMWENFAIASG